jgi:hypothetical protein
LRGKEIKLEDFCEGGSCGTAHIGAPLGCANGALAPVA